MLRQRILAAVIVRSGRAVQSFGYQRWLPLGDVACVVRNLDQWCADGIVVLCTDREDNGPDLKLLNELSALDLSTPISYGGGIRDANDALNAVHAGAERLILDQILSDDSAELANIAGTVGKQALIASVPMLKDNTETAHHWKHWCQKKEPLNQWIDTTTWSQHVSEILAIDVKAEGHQKGMDISLLNALTDLGLPMLAFGGLSNSNHVRQALEQDGVAAAVIGNSLNYQEQSIQTLKLQLTDRPLRPHPSHDSIPFN